MKHFRLFLTCTVDACVSPEDTYCNVDPTGQCANRYADLFESRDVRKKRHDFENEAFEGMLDIAQVLLKITLILL